jgi:glucose/arabinose dehydrogenase
MDMQAMQRIGPMLVMATLTACGDSSSGGFSNTGNNACGASAAPLAASAAMDSLPTAVPPAGAAIAVEPAFEQLTTFTRPLAMLPAPNDDRCWFIVEQSGVVVAFENNADAAQKFTFIDISERVDDSSNEAGLLGMAFHPDYRNNRQVFLSYTGNDGGLTSYVSRFTSTDDGVTLDPDSEEVLLSIAQPFPNHNGGNIEFGPDGYLYIGFGDGGSGNDPQQNAQNTRNLLGAMLRIDVDSAVPYAIPADNPFAANTRCEQGVGAADCPEIYAWGLRNPWRWSFDRDTGELWLGDVGQSASEEIDIIVIGGNYGWPYFEGTRCNTDLLIANCNFVSLPPVTEYPHSSGSAVTGGYVYRGSAIPDLVGVYVYADFSSGNLFQYYDPGSGPVIQAQQPTGLFIASFGQSVDGELYLVNLVTGTLHQIVAAP